MTSVLRHAWRKNSYTSPYRRTNGVTPMLPWTWPLMMSLSASWFKSSENQPSKPIHTKFGPGPMPALAAALNIANAEAEFPTHAALTFVFASLSWAITFGSSVLGSDVKSIAMTETNVMPSLSAVFWYSAAISWP